ncbi:MAG: pyridoxamine 5'-phosphate oxidase family protein [Candidatus Bathyarchaeota archaeon]|nr:MAG: pyridoxamine 5'-phosphate oxidase family protein [Candidatus Bathyarchaeota archaeon]
MSDEVMTDLQSHFAKEQVVHLATAEGNQPRVRPVTLIHLDGRFYVITGARGGVNAAKLAQIRNNPKVEYYLTVKGEGSNGFIRGEGTATIVDEGETKVRLHGEIEWASSYFPTPDHPDYVLLEFHPKGYSYRKPGTADIVKLESK